MRRQARRDFHRHCLPTVSRIHEIREGNCGTPSRCLRVWNRFGSVRRRNVFGKVNNLDDDDYP